LERLDPRRNKPRPEQPNLKKARSKDRAFL
jgi:hypothetical protein